MQVFKPNDVVFDMPSQSLRKVLTVETFDGKTFYTVDCPNDPTGDGAFPTNGRCSFEICASDKTLPLDY